MSRIPFAGALLGASILSLLACGGASDESTSSAQAAIDDVTAVAPATHYVLTSLDGSQDARSMNTPLTQWIEASLEMSYMRKSGEIQAADFNLRARSEREFFGALLTEVSFPDCDGSSKDPAYLGLKFKPEVVRNLPDAGASGNSPRGDRGLIDVQQPLFPAGFQFHLAIDGVRTETVSSVSGLEVRQSATRDDVGELRDSPLDPASPEISGLTVTFDPRERGAWDDWTNAGDARSGTLVYTDPTRNVELVRIVLQNVGIFNVTADPTTNDDDKIHRVRATLRVGQLDLVCIGCDGNDK